MFAEMLRSSGAKICTPCSSLQKLSKENLIAKTGVDASESGQPPLAVQERTVQERTAQQLPLHVSGHLHGLISEVDSPEKKYIRIMFASHRLHGALNREGRKEKSTESESVRDSRERGRRAGMKGASIHNFQRTPRPVRLTARARYFGNDHSFVVELLIS